MTETWQERAQRLGSDCNNLRFEIQELKDAALAKDAALQLFLDWLSKNEIKIRTTTWSSNHPMIDHVVHAVEHALKGKGG